MNAFCLLDDFFAWKAKAMAKEIEIHVYVHASCAELISQEKFDEDLNYEHDTVHDATPPKELPLKGNEAQPCVGKRSESALKLIFSGQTWARSCSLHRKPGWRASASCRKRCASGLCGLGANCARG